MLKLSVKKVLALGIVATLVLGSVPGYAKVLNAPKDHLVYVSQANSVPSVVLGMSAEGAKVENKAYQYLSVSLQEGDDLEEALLPVGGGQIKGFQLRIALDKEVDTSYWKKVAGVLAELEQVIWIHIEADQEQEASEALEAITKVTELMKACFHEVPLNRIRFVYTARTLEDVEALIGKGHKFIGVTLQNLQDIQLLESIYENYGEEVKLTVNDDLLRNDTVLEKELVHLINKFYYELPIKYPNVEVIYRSEGMQNASQAIKNTYYRATAQSWLGLDYAAGEDSGQKEVQYVTEVSDQPLQIFVPVEDETIEYVDYKLNGKTLGRVSNYPYAIQVNIENLYEGNNELRVIVKRIGQETLEVEQSYLRRTTSAVVGARTVRTTPTYEMGQEPSYKSGYIPVLMYHMFKDTVGPTEQSIAVTTQLFKEQVQRLTKEGYTPITFRDYDNYLNGIGGLPSKPYIITADDGYLDNYTHAFPILKEYNIPATFFITTQYVGITTNFDHFTWEQAAEMEASGLVDIQSHTNAHTLMNGVDKEAANYEVNRSFGEIEEKLGKRDVKVLAYPQFLHTYQSQQWLSEFGVQLQMTNLIREAMPSTRVNVKRIHVHNQLSPEALIRTIKKVTE